jgi:hypothetical protein
VDKSGVEAVLSIKWIIDFVRITPVSKSLHVAFSCCTDLPIANSVIDRGMEVCSSLEDMTREGGAVVRANHSLIGGLVPVDSVCHFDFDKVFSEY